MTEAEWWSCTPNDLEKMLAFLQKNRASTRKVWLFSCGCCRGIWPLFKDPRSRAAVEVAEQYVDGLVTSKELEAARNDARDAMEDSRQMRALSVMAHRLTRSEIEGQPWTAASRAFADLLDVGWQTERFHFTKWMTDRQRRRIFDVATRLRDMFGPLPFRVLSIDRAVLEWNDRAAPKIAQTLYDERDFTHLSILADALVDAGCDNQDILDHCRADEGHSRGCWCVDLILEQT